MVIAISHPLDLLRALKGAPAHCLLALLLSGKAQKAVWLQDMTGCSPNTVSAALDVLKRLGLVAHDETGWQPSMELRMEFLAANPGWLEAAAPGLRESPPTTRKSIDAPYLDQTAVGPSNRAPELHRVGAEASNCRTSPPPEGAMPSNCASPAASLEYLKSVEGESRSPPDSDSDSRPSPSNCAPMDLGDAASIARILDATASLFGERVHGPPERYPDVHLLLASIAEAHDHRTVLRKPARVVYTNLRNGVSPASRYLEDPLTHLPDGFLAQAGLPIPERLPSYRGWTSTPEPQDDPAPRPEPQPAISQSVDPAGRYTAEQAWHYVRRQMIIEASPVDYNRRIAPLRLARYSPDPPLFVLAAPDEETRLWLQNRCTRLFVRHLSGVCRTPARVEFVVEPGG